MKVHWNDKNSRFSALILFKTMLAPVCFRGAIVFSPDQVQWTMGDSSAGDPV